MERFDLHAGEESFHGGVIPAVSFAAHAAQDLVIQQPALVVAGAVLHPAIRMEDQAGFDLTCNSLHG